MINKVGTTQPRTQSKAKRAASYNRKSVVRATDDERYTSIDNQRAAAERFIASQESMGWQCITKRYDDSGFSGKDMHRPAYQELLKDIEAGLVDVVVVYRMDRFSRNQRDFVNALAFLDDRGVELCSVTEQIGTTGPTGKFFLQLTIIIAELERDTTAERTRHKMSETRRRGQWTGGRPLLGYDVKDRGLLANDAEAATVRDIYESFLRLLSVTAVAQQLNDAGLVTKTHVSKTGKKSGGRPFSKNCIRKILTSALYIGKVDFEGELHDGQHDAIVDQATWDAVQAKLKKRPRSRPRKSRVSPLSGLLHCARCGCALGPTYTTKRGKTYRYYECASRKKRGAAACPNGRLSAPKVEAAIARQIQAIGRNDGLLESTVRASGGEVDVADLQAVLTDFDPLWEVLTMEEQAEVLGILVERIDYDTLSGEFRLNLSPDGARLLAGEGA